MSSEIEAIESMARVINLHDTNLQELEGALSIILSRLEAVERRTQSLPERPIIQNCPECGARVSGPNPNCHMCGITL